jgi:flagellum-specific ATP synthase
MAETALLAGLRGFALFPARGRVRRIRSGEIEADGPSLPVGAHCLVRGAAQGVAALRAQVVGVSAGGVLLLPFGPVDPVRIGDWVEGAPHHDGALAGDHFAGRTIDALGEPLDGGPAVLSEREPHVAMPAVLDRVSPSQPFPTGIRAIDGLLTIGRGQRIGIFAASGVGKTSLVEQILRQARCHRAVVCLVGERGREVEALWQTVHRSEAAARTTLVAATADESAPMRARAVEMALGLAEHWRAKGEDVLLVVDSVTRLAMALREIGLIAGEPPTARAYTPNVFRELPMIVERCGATRSGGAITAVFTVLSETDDVDDPIVELMKSLLDGHVVLSRKLAQAGHFPAIDIGRSISRLFDRLVDEPHRGAARVCRAALADYEEARVLIESGMYKAGSDAAIDAAITARAALRDYLRQPFDHFADWSEARGGLLGIAGQGGQHG